VAASTVYRVLRRYRLNRLAWLDRPTGQPVRVRRYERAQPGELVHLDVKKLGRIPDGGGHRAHGRDSAQHRARDRVRGPGYEYVHALVDDHSRLAYAEVLDDEQGVTCAGFLTRAGAVFAAYGIQIERVLTDNALAYRHSRAFRAAVAALGAVQRFTRPYHPQTNGKVQRFNRTLLAEWAYIQVYAGNQQRRSALDDWLHAYNHHRAHTALGGLPPISRVNNPPALHLADQCERQPGVGRVDVHDPNLAVGGLVDTGAAGDGQREPRRLLLAEGPGAHPLHGDLPFGQHQGDHALHRKPLRGAGGGL
jgi:transposase InsO family protein